MVGWMGRWLDGWVDGWMGRWMDGWMDGWVDGWMDGWMGGWVDGWMDGWMGRWMDGVGESLWHGVSQATVGRVYSGECGSYSGQWRPLKVSK